MRGKEEIVIGGATREDAPAIHALLRALAAALDRPHDVRSTPDDIARYGFGLDPAFETMIARRGGEAVGLVLFFYEFSTWRGCPGVYIQDLYVDASLRGSGLGRRLLAAVAARAAARDARYMRLSVDVGNDEGLGFYGRLSFTAPHEQTLVLDGDPFARLARS
ncbi:MAG TPA: GNAT family N-acetyltransferase [Rhizomicrobium sp.]|nr:GNAT family N-acetyltransferase [Rhizomicrobium sp.]